MLTFVVVTKISIKKLKEKMCFLLFFCVVENSHFCRCRNANANILQKSLTFLCLLGISIRRTF